MSAPGKAPPQPAIDLEAARAQTGAVLPAGLAEGRTVGGHMPAVLVVMGVSGSGKSTISALLAGRLGWEFEDGDWFHPQANVDKMQAGTPLTDDDRWPWLHSIAQWIDVTREAGGHGVVACSALKRSYRDILVGSRDDVRIVYLKGDAEVIERRMFSRSGHFMPPAMLNSQLATLEEPGADERPITVSIEGRPQSIVDEVLSRLEAEFVRP